MTMLTMMWLLYTKNIDLELKKFDVEIKFKKSQGLDREKPLKMILKSYILI